MSVFIPANNHCLIAENSRNTCNACHYFFYGYGRDTGHHEALVLNQLVKPFTCVIASAVGVSMVVIVSVFCGESHASAVAHGVRQVTRELADLKGVVL